MADARTGFVVRLGALALCLLVLGLLSGEPSEPISVALRFSAAFLIVLLSFVALRSRQAQSRLSVAGIALAIAWSIVLLATDLSVTSGVFAAVLVLFAAGYHQLLPLLNEAPLARTPTFEIIGRGPQERTSIDDWAAHELARARRHERPFSVVSISIAGRSGTRWMSRRRQVEGIAHALAECLRRSDGIGIVGRSRLLALLPESGRDEAVGLTTRLSRLLDYEDTARMRVGIASFPSDELTWVGLKELAIEREAPIGQAVASTLGEVASRSQRAAG